VIHPVHSSLMANLSNFIFCGDIGLDRTVASPGCCYLNDQSDSACSIIFGEGLSTPTIFTEYCPSGNCVHDCQNLTLLYTASGSYETDGPIEQYWTCANLPAIAQFYQKGLLMANNSEYVGQFVPANSSSESLQNITAAVIQCLTDTCSSARHSQTCANACSPVKLLTNSTMPNLDGISNCLFTLCNSGYDSVPFANTDIAGIGVRYT
jgi:hypothetical protein